MRIRTKTGIYDVSGLKVYVKGLEDELPEDVDQEQIRFIMICESYTEPERQTVLLEVHTLI